MVFGHGQRGVARSCRCTTALIIVLWLAGCGELVPAQQRVAGADPQAGRVAVTRVACGICHVIPGVPGAEGIVGPSLEGFAQRQLIGGIAPNQPALLAQWVRNAPSIAPDTGMPELPLTDAQARDVAAYLYTLR
ncbi:MAG: c-type cytochrome [Methylocella sp.]